MFIIKDVTNYTLSYTCGCGAIGKCMFIPVEKNTPLVIDLKCPMCGNAERLRIKTADNSDKLSWAIVVDNDIISTP
jgi:hypothetical protein